MNASVNILDQYAGLLAAIVGMVLGLGMLLFAREMGPRTRRWLGALVFCGLIAASGAVSYFLSARQFGIALAILAAIWGLGWLLRSKDSFHRVLARLGNPSVQAAILLLGGIPIAAAWCGYVDSQESPQGLPGDIEAITEGEAILKEKKRDGYTDQGTPIALYVRVERPGTLDQEADVARRAQKNAPLLRLIKTGKEDAICNCHGWVFTHGRYWVSNDDVPTILKENGYREVEQPTPGDAIIYYDAKGQAIHTGLVQGLTSEGLILVESKWSYLGRYIHAPEDQGYSQAWKFYRSARKGHVLRGLEGTPEYDQNRPLGGSAAGTPAA